MRSIKRGSCVALILALVGVAAACGSTGEGAEGETADSTGLAESTTTSSVRAGEDDLLAPTAPVDVNIDVAGRRLHLVCKGSGGPPVLVEMGAGAEVGAWSGIVDALAQDRRACVYERAGIGESEPGSEPRTAQRAADELHTLLEAADMAGPVIVLSHSLGGLVAQAFAQRHPDDVAALVFVEPRTAEYQLGYRENLTEDELALDEASTQAAIDSLSFGPELEAIDASAAAVDAAGPLPDVPVIVLSAGIPCPDESQADQAFWLATHEQLAAQVTNGTARVVADGDHDMFLSKPQALLDAVGEVSDQL